MTPRSCSCPRTWVGVEAAIVPLSKGGFMKLFRQNNTEGYSDAELDAMNEEWEERARKAGLEEDTDEWEEAAKRFSDEVSGR